MENNGWIKLHRKILENPISKKPNYSWLWVTLLLIANHKEHKIMWDGEFIIIKEGQVLTGRKELSEKTGIPESSIERILKVLENEHQIEQQKTTKFRLITVINWKEYQNKDSKTNNKRTTSEQQADTNKNDKKVKNDKNINPPGVQEIMNLFYEINPSLNFGSPFERKACASMLAKWPLESVKAMAIQVIACQSEDRYAPRATTPSKMWTKIGEFQAYFKSKKSNKPKVAVI